MRKAVDNIRYNHDRDVLLLKQKISESARRRLFDNTGNNCSIYISNKKYIVKATFCVRMYILYILLHVNPQSLRK